MGPGRVTTTREAWMATVESAQRATQGSLQLLASGVGPEVLQGCGGRLSVREAKLKHRAEREHLAIC